MLTNACKNAENNWLEKDICYTIGNINNNGDIKSIWFVYGDCYSASPSLYERVKNKISNAISELGLELTPTNEIAKIKKLDPLGISDLRIRGMWTIKHPRKVFNYLVSDVTSENGVPKYKIHVLMQGSKFYSYSKEIRNALEKVAIINEVKIKDPNNPAVLMNAFYIKYVKY